MPDFVTMVGDIPVYRSKYVPEGEAYMLDMGMLYVSHDKLGYQSAFAHPVGLPATGLCCFISESITKMAAIREAVFALEAVRLERQNDIRHGQEFTQA